MMKKLLLPILALYLFTHSVGCTSSDAQEESDVAVSDDESFSNEAEEDFADGSESSEESSDEGSEEDGDEVAEGESDGEAAEEGGELAENEGEGEELEGEESLEGGEEVAASEEESTEGDEDSEFPEDVADETESMDGTSVAENETQNETPSDENLFTGDTASATEVPPTEEAPPAEGAGVEPLAEASPAETAEAAPEAPAELEPAPRTAFAPLQKIKDVPFERGGGLLNRVYIARPGDKLKDVSQKIYGSDRTSDLQKWNPGIRRNLRTGDKVYYNSPTEPQDSTRLLTYFEDKGIPPQVHVTKDGDNIRTLGKSLLGNGDGWKELWSTNLDVASKGALPAGVELKYWPETASAAAATAPPPPGTVAGVDPTAPPPVDPTTPPMADPTAPVPPDNGLAQNGAPPADPTAMPPLDDPTAMPPGDMAAADPLGAPPANSPETAPPPIANTEPIAPAMPEADPVKKKAPATAEVASADDTTIMIGIAGIALLLLVGVVVIMKKNRSRRIDLSQTQV